jgi:prophage regulatory protein
MQAKVDARAVGPDDARVVLAQDARFICTKEVRSMVLYTPEHLRTLEQTASFPKRIRIGDNRVVWLESEILEWLESRQKRNTLEHQLRTYHLRLCRPRFETLTVSVNAANPAAAEEAALALANTNQLGWHMEAFDPSIYRPHAQVFVSDDKGEPTSETAYNFLAKYQHDYVRYLVLYADSKSGAAAVLDQPWLEKLRLSLGSCPFAANWTCGIESHSKLASTR